MNRPNTNEDKFRSDETSGHSVPGALSSPSNSSDHRAHWSTGTLGEWLDRHYPTFDIALDGELITDAHGIILRANAAAAAIIRCPYALLVGRPLGLFFTGHDRREFYAYLNQISNDSHQPTVELQLARHPTNRREIELTAKSIGLDQGLAPGYYWWLLRDLTLARQSEREVQRHQRMLDHVVETADVIVLIVDAVGQITRTNPYLHKLTGYEAHDLLSRNWCYALLSPDDRASGRRILAQALAHGAVQAETLRLSTRSGALRNVIWSVRSLTSEQGLSAVLIGHDLTELQAAQEMAIRAERLAAIGEMAAGLAHECRNAIQRSHACLMLLGLRLEGQPDMLDLLARAQKAQDELHHLYEGALQYAAPIPLKKTYCNIAAVWREAWREQAWSERGIDAELVEEVNGIDTICHADGFYLKRLFGNLFENSQAATDGPLQVRVECAMTMLGHHEAIRIGVRDNGPGFSEAARLRIFEAFFTTKLRGTGLGLALCKRIVEEHGGCIHPGSQEGKGAEIVIILPRSNT